MEAVGPACFEAAGTATTQTYPGPGVWALAAAADAEATTSPSPAAADIDAAPSATGSVDSCAASTGSAVGLAARLPRLAQSTRSPLRPARPSDSVPAQAGDVLVQIVHLADGWASSPIRRRLPDPRAGASSNHCLACIRSSKTAVEPASEGGFRGPVRPRSPLRA